MSTSADIDLSTPWYPSNPTVKGEDEADVPLLTLPNYGHPIATFSCNKVESQFERAFSFQGQTLPYNSIRILVAEYLYPENSITVQQYLQVFSQQRFSLTEISIVNGINHLWDQLAPAMGVFELPNLRILKLRGCYDWEAGYLLQRLALPASCSVDLSLHPGFDRPDGSDQLACGLQTLFSGAWDKKNNHISWTACYGKDSPVGHTCPWTFMFSAAMELAPGQHLTTVFRLTYRCFPRIGSEGSSSEALSTMFGRILEILTQTEVTQHARGLTLDFGQRFDSVLIIPSLKMLLFACPHTCFLNISLESINHGICDILKQMFVVNMHLNTDGQNVDVQSRPIQKFQIPALPNLQTLNLHSHTWPWTPNAFERPETCASVIDYLVWRRSNNKMIETLFLPRDNPTLIQSVRMFGPLLRVVFHDEMMRKMIESKSSFYFPGGLRIKNCLQPRHQTLVVN